MIIGVAVRVGNFVECGDSSRGCCPWCVDIARRASCGSWAADFGAGGWHDGSRLGGSWHGNSWIGTWTVGRRCDGRWHVVERLWRARSFEPVFVLLQYLLLFDQFITPFESSSRSCACLRQLDKWNLVAFLQGVFLRFKGGDLVLDASDGTCEWSLGMECWALCPVGRRAVDNHLCNRRLQPSSQDHLRCFLDRQQLAAQGRLHSLTHTLLSKSQSCGRYHPSMGIGRAIDGAPEGLSTSKEPAPRLHDITWLTTGIVSHKRPARCLASLAEHDTGGDRRFCQSDPSRH